MMEKTDNYCLNAEALKGNNAITVMGCRGSLPVFGDDLKEFGGQTSCYVYRQDNKAIVMDCGSGLFDAEELLAGCDEIDVILTHLHYDHIIGILNGILTLVDRKVRFITTYSQWDIRRYLSKPYWPFDPVGNRVFTTARRKKVNLVGGNTCEFYEACHPDGASIIKFNLQGKNVCLMADHEHQFFPDDSYIENCDLLIFDGTYTNEEYPYHVGWGHSTIEIGCEYAIHNKVKNILITHHSPARSDAELRKLEKNAREINPACSFARAGMKINIQEL